jgi:hypothetical protein
MPHESSAALPLSHKLLRLFTGLNLIYGLLILILLIASLIDPAWVMEALGAGRQAGASRLSLGMRGVMLLGLAGVPLTHLILSRLLAIVDTVREGDPFVLSNAQRLRAIAWFLLALETLHLAVGAVAAAASSPGHPLDLDWNFSFTRWLAVGLLFVLAQVFEQGAMMREDLAATI